MNRGTIAAIDPQAPQGLGVNEPDAPDMSEAENGAAADDWWDEPAVRPTRRWGALVAGTLAICGLVGWTALFLIANLDALRVGGSLLQWTGWVRDWAVPVVLICVSWLLAMRNSRREALRFGDTARMLSDESRKLEARLTTVNRELSLAREFIAAQSRDIDSLGRVATERLSLHAEKLVGLIHDNGTRIDAIGDVSTAALENMEKLRSQLPVIASSAKDVTNNIGTAGRAAHTQLDDLISGFKQLNDFGQASERQVLALRGLVDETISQFTLQADQLGDIAQQRFVALSAGGDEVRAAIELQEADALAAIRVRAAALCDELAGVRGTLDQHEAESLTSLRARLTAVRDESSMLARSVRDGEQTALTAWQMAIAKLEADLRTAIAQVSEIDRHASESSNNRLAALASEAQRIDDSLAERDRLFVDNLEQRQHDFDTRNEQFIAQLAGQMAALDQAAGAHRNVQEAHLSSLQQRHDEIGTQLAGFSEQVAAIAAQGGDVEGKLRTSIAGIADHLAASSGAISQTDSAVAVLTDNAVRLLELLQASVKHTGEHLPTAIAASEGRLIKVEERVRAVHALSGEAASRGEMLLAHTGRSREALAGTVEQIGALQGEIARSHAQNGASLSDLQHGLEAIRAESLALAEHAQGELAQSIEQLRGSARDAVAGIEAMSAQSITALAARIGDESGAALDAALRDRAAQVAGQLEQASANAAGISREAAVQLRDQLAKVNELAGNLERRVAHARSKAEEQVDHDFARRVALITESLNSNAIDIARALDSDVTDTSWAAYLKGDRGIFTRRAVRLLDAPEAKAVAQLYEADREFREHVSRYIHDFEAMLRQLLSTRDGHALGVTLLSSDMGKLYVALAQAIERLRN